MVFLWFSHELLGPSALLPQWLSFNSFTSLRAVTVAARPSCLAMRAMH
jgi:hypothetical protein